MTPTLRQHIEAESDRILRHLCEAWVPEGVQVDVHAYLTARSQVRALCVQVYDATQREAERAREGAG